MPLRRNNIQHFNPSQCEEHLSQFGRIVLDLLIKHQNTECERNINSPQLSARRPRPSCSAPNRILTFRDSNILGTPAPSVFEQINSGDLNDRRPSVINPSENTSPTLSFVPTSAQLVRTEEPNTTSDNDYISRDDLINSTIENSNSKCRIVATESYDLLNSKSAEDEDISSLDINILRGDKTHRTRAIDWNDMFDTELFPEVPTAAILDDIRNDLSKEKHVHQFPEHSEKTLIKNVNNEKKVEIGKKVSKRRNQSKITDAVPKKVKRVAPTECSKTLIKNSFRKQKYTKTVKNWLNTVDPSNTVEEHDDSLDPQGIKVQKVITNKDSNPEITVKEKGKEKTNKKIVQAQLVNKDGIMKFRKPKNVKDNEKSKPQETLETENQDADKDHVHKYKKTKSKFVAPINSQIPVKDLTFNINTVDDTNINQHGKVLCNLESKEVIAVLIYSNGFCQLNNHHTEDACNAEGIMFHVDDDFYYLKGNDEHYREILTQVMKQNNITCYDGKNILIYLMSQFQMEFNDALNITDAKIGGSLVDPDNPPENFTELQKLLNLTTQYTIATECVLQKAAWYTTLLKECMIKLKNLLINDLLWIVFIDIEMKLLPIIADMERRGVCVDLEKLKSMENILLTKMKKVEQECYKAAGKVFQINSTAQVRTILYDELQLDTKCNVKIRETISMGAKSTSETMLRNLVSAHPLPKLILEYRHLHKAHATFLTGIAQHVKNGVVKPTWEQTAAATGRVASNNPNLQAIPKIPFSLVMFPEADDNACPLQETQVLSFRSVYVPRGGHWLLAADFQHVECRVFAHLAADAELLDALGSARDLFRVLTAKWLNKCEQSVSVSERERTKRVVYASLYGAGARRLADILAVPYHEALAVAASFNRTFPSLRRFGQAVVGACARAEGRLRTLCGRARRLPHIASSDAALRAHAERQAINFVVQGSAADLCKAAMVSTAAALRGAGAGLRCRLVLQIHDELVWEVRDDHLHDAAALLKRAMESCGRRCGVELALPVALSAGRTWGDMRPLAPRSVAIDNNIMGQTNIQ